MLTVETIERPRGFPLSRQDVEDHIGGMDIGLDYQIQVFRSGGVKRGEGTLRCDAIGLLDRFEAGQPLMLMLRSGEQVSATIKNPGDFRVDILVTGPIPDPIDEHDSAD